MLQSGLVLNTETEVLKMSNEFFGLQKALRLMGQGYTLEKYIAVKAKNQSPSEWRCIGYVPDSDGDVTAHAGDMFKIYRPKINIAGFGVPAPVESELTYGQEYYAPDPLGETLFKPFAWINSDRDCRNLRRGLIHLDIESARQHARVLILAVGGIPDAD